MTKSEFNRLAEKIGCRARIEGTKKNIKFYEFCGRYTSDNCEIIYPISSQKFSQLIENFNELQNI